MAPSGNRRLSGRVAFTYPSFVLYESARFFIVLATEMQSVAVGWQVYEITKRPLDLGLVGLAQFLPGVLLFLVSGHTADRYDRRKVLVAGYAGFALCSGLLLAITLRGARSVDLIYAVMALVGVVVSFNAPASRAILPLLVPEEHFQNAFAWGATIFQAATILGPAAGGFEYALLGPGAVYASAVVAAAAAAFSMLGVKFQKMPARPREMLTWKTVLAGLHYIWRQKLVLGSISLDLFAVLLIALVFVGATDMVSVVVRGVLVQLATPDEMRGRVNAVDMIFIGASNQLGQFESGVTAALLGTVPAVLLGGIGTLFVTALWAWMFPELRNADTLTLPDLQATMSAAQAADRSAASGAD